MAGIDVKMGVSGIAQFKSAMQQGQQSVKTLDAQLKLTEKQYQATGDKETYMTQKTKLLQQQMEAQNKVIKEGQKALKAMETQGVDPASKAYQKMQQDVVNAQSALLDMNSELNSVGQSASETAQKTDKLTNSLNGINKKVSFDAVLNGIGKITDGMEAAARKVEALARDVWDTMAMAASWADNENTLAAMYGIDVETLQRMQGASRTIDTSVESIIKSQQKLKNNMVYGSDDVKEAFQKLGVSIGYVTGKGNEISVFRDATDVFWEAGEALKTYSDEVERDAMANKIFGRSWQELMPLFNAGREKYEQTLAEQSIVTEANVNKLNELDDALQRLDQDYQATKNTILSELAPAFTEVANTVSGLIRQFNEYLQTDEGQAKLEDLSQAVTELFSGLSDVDFGTALDTAKGILDTITGALGWIKDNKDGVIDAIKGIGGAFVLLKAAEVVGTLTQAANGLISLLGGSGVDASSSGGGVSVPRVTGGNTGDYTTSWIDKSLAIGTGIKTVFGKIGTAITTAAPYALFAETVKLAGDAVDKAGTARYDDFGQKMEEIADTSNDAANGVLALRDALDILGQAYLGEYETGVQGAFKALDPELLRQIMPDSDLWKWVDLYGGNWNATVDSLSGTALMEYAEQFANGFADALKEAQKPKMEVDPELSPDSSSLLQGELNGMTLTVSVMPDLSSIDGSHANGLPFVPFDGYIAALHKGERVVPANQNKNYNNTSNVYFDHVNVNNGADADGLAALIAERTRHTLAGFGG